MTLHPTNLEGIAALVPYQLELAAINAAIKQMKKHDKQNTPTMYCPMHTNLCQTQMMCTINMLLVKLNNKVNLLLAATTCPKKPTPRPPSTLLLPSTTLTTICHKSTPQLPHVHPPKNQILPWPLHHTNPCSQLACVSKFSLYKCMCPPNPLHPQS